jgi:deoxyribonucleoside regulator
VIGDTGALPPDQYRLIVRVSRLYYESELTQEQIGVKLGISRMKVNRLLTLARTAGIVQVRIVEHPEPFGKLSHRLLTTFELQDVRIAAAPLEEDGGPDEDALRSVIAAEAAAWLVDRLEPKLVVGLGLGRTVSRLPESFAPNRQIDAVFATLEGVGTSPNAGFASYNVTSRLADAVGGTAEIVSAPTFVSDPSLQGPLLSEPSVAASIDIARNAGIAIQSIGTVSSDATLFRHGTLTDDDLQQLRDAGAVGDALGHFYDDDGQHVPWWTDNTHVGLTLDEVKKLPTSAVVAGGAAKVAAIRAALRGGIFNVLITDDVSAEMLLELGT